MMVWLTEHEKSYRRNATWTRIDARNWKDDFEKPSPFCTKQNRRVMRWTNQIDFGIDTEHCLSLKCFIDDPGNWLIFLDQRIFMLSFHKCRIVNLGYGKLGITLSRKSPNSSLLNKDRWSCKQNTTVNCNFDRLSLEYFTNLPNNSLTFHSHRWLS